MAQYTSSQTTPNGFVFNTVFDTESFTKTFTVTAPNGTVATNTQNSNENGTSTANLTALRDQLAAGGVDLNDVGISFIRAVRETSQNVNVQADTAADAARASNTSPPAEKQAIPVPTKSDPAVPQPTDNTPPVTTKEAPPFDPNQDEFGNLVDAQAAAADRAPDTQSPEDVNAGLDDALANRSQDEDVEVNLPAGLDPDQDPFEAARLQAEADYDAQEPGAFEAKDLGIEEDSWLSQKFGEVKSYLNRASLQSEDAQNAASEAATIAKAKAQATLQARYKQPGNNDWRVRLVLAEGSDYLYNANPPGILKPLLNSNGVIFPYTPQISTAYTANYDKYDLTHSNYRGYFYKNSAVNDLNITATFTAQDTQEAEYLLAVIHFFRSATKMFYGKDAQRGAPPPLVYLIGYGDFQFNGHPCLIANFNYNLPHDVDYIRANNPNNYGTNMLNRRTATTSTAPAIATINRLTNAIDSFGRSLFPGAIPSTPSPGTVPGSVNNLNRSTYVPTKMEIQLTLLPVQSRAQVSKQFSVKSFANGDGLKGGFW